jgi:GAF domain-containing protein
VDQVIPSDAANINLIENGWTRVVRARGYDRIHTDIETVSLCVADTPSLRQILETGEALVISDTSTDPNWTSLPDFDWSQSYAGAPIHSRDEIIGFLNIDSATPGYFEQAHADRLQAFADEVSMAINNARLF